MPERRLPHARLSPRAAGGEGKRSKPIIHWTVYILRTRSGRLYTGITTDLERRFREHGRSRRGAKALRGDAPVGVAWSETHADRASASRREAAIKRMTRAAKLALVEG